MDLDKLAVDTGLYECQIVRLIAEHVLEEYDHPQAKVLGAVDTISSLHPLPLHRSLEELAVDTGSTRMGLGLHERPPPGVNLVASSVVLSRLSYSHNCSHLSVS